jgi:hypothetical protein
MHPDLTLVVIGWLIGVPIMSLVLALTFRLALRWAGRLKIGYGAAYLTTVLTGLGLLAAGIGVSLALPEGTAEKVRLGGPLVAACVVHLRHKISYFRGLVVTVLWVVMNVLSVAAVALVIVLIGAARSSAKPAPSADHGAPQVRIAESTNSTRAAVERVTGAVDVDVELPRVLRGWFFMNGELRGRLPMREHVTLTPGDYEVRLVIARTDPEACLLISCSQQFHVAPGSATEAALHIEDESVGLAENRDGWSIQHEGDLKPEIVAYVQGTPPSRYGEDKSRLWNEFLDCEEWKAVTSARISEGTKNQVWMSLPQHLGGPREVDAEQLRVIGNWLLYRFDMTVGQEGSIWLESDLGFQEFKRLQQRNKRWRREVDTVIAQTIRALESRSQ